MTLTRPGFDLACARTFSNPEESSQGHEESLRLCIKEKSRRTYIHVPKHHMGALYELVYYTFRITGGRKKEHQPVIRKYSFSVSVCQDWVTKQDLTM